MEASRSSILAGALVATFAYFQPDGPAPSGLVGIGAGLGRHFPAHNLRLWRDRPGLFPGELGRRLFAIFPSPAAKETHAVMVDRRLPDPRHLAVLGRQGPPFTCHPGRAQDGNVTAAAGAASGEEGERR